MAWVIHESFGGAARISARRVSAPGFVAAVWIDLGENTRVDIVVDSLDDARNVAEQLYQAAEVLRAIVTTDAAPTGR